MNRFLFTIIFSFVSFGLCADTDNSDNAENVLQEKICSPTECYTVVKKLGEGAFGNVYSVENSNGMPFAIKTYKGIYQDQYYSDAEREFSRGQILNHPNIIKTHDMFLKDLGTGELEANIVLDLVKGKTLCDTNEGDLSQEGALKAAIQLVDALGYALSLEMMHFDLHDGNVMLDTDENIMVIDLASFFTFEELYKFAAAEAKSLSENETDSDQYQPFSLAAASIKIDKGILPTKEKTIAVAEPEKNRKLRKILKQDPRLLKILLQMEEKLAKAQPANLELLISVSNKSASVENTNEDEKSNIDEQSKIYLQGYYFERLTEICTDLISKSGFNNVDQVFLRSEIRKILMECEKDISHGESNSFSIYFQQLVKTLQSP